MTLTKSVSRVAVLQKIIKLYFQANLIEKLLQKSCKFPIPNVEYVTTTLIVYIRRNLTAKTIFRFITKINYYLYLNALIRSKLNSTEKYY